MAESRSSEQSTFLGIPLEIRLIVYKYLLVDDSTNATKLSHVDYYEYEKSEDATGTPVRLLSFRNADPKTFSLDGHSQKRRSIFRIRAGRFRAQTMPTTYHCTNLFDIHANILAVNHQMHQEAAPVLYTSYTFDFNTHIESCIPFLEDLTPYSRSLIQRLKVVKKALPYEKDFDRCEWRTMCEYISSKLLLNSLSLGVVSGKPIMGWDKVITPFPESDFESMVKIHRRDEMQWVRDLLLIKGLKHLEVAPYVEHCPPPNSNAMSFFIAFSASINGGFTNYLSHQMLHVAQAA